MPAPVILVKQEEKPKHVSDKNSAVLVGNTSPPHPPGYLITLCKGFLMNSLSPLSSIPWPSCLHTLGVEKIRSRINPNLWSNKRKSINKNRSRKLSCCLGCQLIGGLHGTWRPSHCIQPRHGLRGQRKPCNTTQQLTLVQGVPSASLPCASHVLIWSNTPVTVQNALLTSNQVNSHNIIKPPTIPGAFPCK